MTVKKTQSQAVFTSKSFKVMSMFYKWLWMTNVGILAYSKFYLLEVNCFSHKKVYLW